MCTILFSVDNQIMSMGKRQFFIKKWWNAASGKTKSMGRSASRFSGKMSPGARFSGVMASSAWIFRPEGNPMGIPSFCAVCPMRPTAKTSPSFSSDVIEPNASVDTASHQGHETHGCQPLHAKPFRPSRVQFQLLTLDSDRDDQSSTFRQLFEESGWNLGRRRGHQDALVGSVLSPPFTPVA